MIQNLKDYIMDLDYRIIIYKDKINIINYKKILSLKEREIVLMVDNRKIVIKGTDLKLKRMVDQEILILGKIQNLEVQDE